MTVATNITNKVIWLDEASHTVKLEPGCVEDGSRNGKVVKPTVRRTQLMAIADPANASPALPVRKHAVLARRPSTPSNGNSQITGQRSKLAIHNPVPLMTTLFKGFEGAEGSTATCRA